MRLHGVIERRILVNYRVDPEPLQRLLPSPFRVLRVRGHGVAGICLIRLGGLRLPGMPACLGLSSENGAHRIAVTWEENGRRREGVYVPRRDTSSCLAVAAGGRLFPGKQHFARFSVRESGGRYRVALNGRTHVSVDGRIASRLPASSLFRSVDEASAFFERGSVGFSPHRRGAVEGIELRTDRWRVEPLDVTSVRSSFFEDPALFPAGSVAFDHALLMRGIRHEWRTHPAA